CALSAALVARAREVGVELRCHTTVRHVERRADRVALHSDGPSVEARLVVAADGLASPLRRAAGLERPARGPRRFGLRQHFACPAWSPFVEIHFSAGLEAYVTPAGANRVGVAFLWQDGCAPKPVLFSNLLNQFPRLKERLAGVAPDSEARGAGPLLRAARARTADRFVLLGDAGGYVDAITGQGLSLAFHCAAA